MDIYGNLLFVCNYNNGVRVYELNAFETGAPIANIVSHSDNDTILLDDTAIVEVDVTNKDAVTVEFLVDGKPYKKDFVPPYELYYYAQNAGSVTMQARVMDLSGNVGYTSLITLNIGEDTINPVVQNVTGDTQGTVGELLDVAITVTDNIAVDHIVIDFDETAFVMPSQGYSDDFETGDFSAQAWTFTGSSNRFWNITTDEKYEGSYSAQGPTSLTDSQNSSMFLTVDIPEATTISFYYKLETESCCDKLRLYVDGNLVLNVGGYSGWTFFSTPLTVGTHNLQFMYYKDGSVCSGRDTVWVDKIEIGSGGSAEPLDIVTLPVPDGWSDLNLVTFETNFGINGLLTDNVFTVTPYDVAGNQGDAVDVTITTSQNGAPVVKITSHEDGDIIRAGAVHTLQFRVKDLGLTPSINTIEVLQNGSQIYYNNSYTGDPGTPTSVSVNFTVANSDLDEPLSLNVIVTDDELLSSEAVVELNPAFIFNGQTRSINITNCEWFEIRGQYAFLGGSSGIRVVDIGTFNLVSQDTMDSRYVYHFAIAGDYLYAPSDGGGMYIFDISEPTKIRRVKVISLNAYFAVYNGNDTLFTIYNNSIVSYDISDRENPVFIQSLVRPTNDFPYSAILDNTKNYLYVGDQDALFSYNVSNPANMQELAQLDTQSSNNHNGLAIKDNKLYASIDYYGIVVFDLNTSKATPTRILYLSDTGKDSDGIDVFGNYLYQVKYDRLDVYSLPSLDLVTQWTLNSSCETVKVHGYYVYVSRLSSSTTLTEFDFGVGKGMPVFGATNIMFDNDAIVVTGTASDDDQATVELIVNGRSLDSAKGPAFTMSIPVSPEEFGTDFSISLRARDLFNNSISTATQVINIPDDRDAPVIAITSPLDGTSVSENIELIVEASILDALPIRSVELLMDYGTGFQVLLADTDPELPFAGSVLIPRVTDASNISIKLRATDWLGNVGESLPVNLSVLEDTAPPVVSIISPEDNDTVYANSNVLVTFTADDSSSIGGSIDAIQVTLSGGVPIVIDSDQREVLLRIPASMTNQSATIEVTAYDMTGNIGTDSVTITIDVPLVARILSPNSSANSVSVINVETGVIEATIPVTSANKVDISPDGSRIYVASGNVRGMYAIDPLTYNVKTINMATSYNGTNQWEAIFKPELNLAYVLDYNTTINLINTQTDTMQSFIYVPTNGYDMDISPDGTEIYTINNSNTIAVVNLISQATQTFPSQNNETLRKVTIPADGTKAYFATYYSEDIQVMNMATKQFVTIIPLTYDLENLVSGVSSQGYVPIASDTQNTIFKIDPKTDTVMATLSGFGDIASLTVPQSDPTKLLVATTTNGVGELSIVDIDSFTIIKKLYSVYGENGVGYLLTPDQSAVIPFTVSMVSPLPGTYTSRAKLLVKVDVSNPKVVSDMHFKIDGTVVNIMHTPPFETTITLPDVSTPLNDVVIEVEAFTFGGASASDQILVDVVPDNTAPIVSIASTNATGNKIGATDVLFVNVAATDNAGVALVELYINGALFDNDTQAPYDFGLRLSENEGAVLDLYARAFDENGNQAVSSVVSLTVASKPFLMDVILKPNYGAYTFTVFDAKSYKRIADYGSGNSYYPYNIVATKDGKKAYTARTDYYGRLYRFNLLNGNREQDYEYTGTYDIYSRALMLSKNEDLLFCARPNHDKIDVFDTLGHTGFNYLFSISDFQTIDQPERLFRSADEKYILVCNHSGTERGITVMNAVNGMIIKNIPTIEPGTTSQYTPYEVATIAGSPYAFVSTRNSRLFIINLDTLSVEKVIALNSSSYAVAAGYTPEGPKAFVVTVTGPETIYKINADTLQVEATVSLDLYDADFGELTPDGKALFFNGDASSSGATDVVDSVTLLPIIRIESTNYNYGPMYSGKMFDNVPPTIFVTSPVQGTELVEGKRVNVAFNATDNFVLQQVELLLDNESMGISTVAPSYPIQMQVPAFTGEGQSIVVRAVARDAAGNTTAMVPVTYGVVADTQAPNVAILSPAHGSDARLNSLVTLALDITDDGGIAQVQISVNDRAEEPVTQPPFTAATFRLDNGVIGEDSVIAVTVIDSVGNSASTSITLNVLEPVFDIIVAASYNQREIHRLDFNGMTSVLNAPGGTNSGQFTDMASTHDGEYLFALSASTSQSFNKIRVYKMPQGTLVREIDDTGTFKGRFSSIVIDKNDRFAYVSTEWNSSSSSPTGNSKIVVLDIPVCIDPESTGDPIFTTSYDGPSLYNNSGEYVRVNLALSHSGNTLWAASPSTYNSSTYYSRRWTVTNLESTGSLPSAIAMNYGWDVENYFDGTNDLIYMPYSTDDYRKFHADTGSNYYNVDINVNNGNISIGKVSDTLSVMAIAYRSSNIIYIRKIEGGLSSDSYTSIANVSLPYVPMDSDFTPDGKYLFVYYQSNTGYSVIKTSDWSHTYYPTSGIYRRILMSTATDAVNPTIELAADPVKESYLVGEEVSLVATVDDNQGVEFVEYYLNGGLLGTDAQTPFAFPFVGNVPSGATPFEIQAKAYDFAGNSALSSIITITVVDDSIAPTVTIAAVTDLVGVNAGMPVVVTANAQDNASISRVEYTLFDGVNSSTAVATVPPYQTILYLDDNVSNSQVFTITAVAVDGAGNVSDLSNILNGITSPETFVKQGKLFSIAYTSAYRLFVTDDITHATTELLINNADYIKISPLQYGFLFRQGNDEVIVFNKFTREIVKVFTYSDGFDGPRDIAFDAVRKLAYITSAYNNKVMVVSLESLTVVHQITTSNTGTRLYYPWSVVVTPDGQYLYVSNQSFTYSDPTYSRILVFNLDDYSEVKRYSDSSGVGLDYEMVMLPYGNKAYITNTNNNGTLYEIDTASTSFTQIKTNVGGQYPVGGLTPMGLRVFMFYDSPDDIYMYNPETGEAELWLDMASLPSIYAMDISDDGRYLYMATSNNYIRKIEIATKNIEDIAMPIGTRDVDYHLLTIFDTVPPSIVLNGVPSSATEGTALTFTALPTSSIGIRNVSLYINGERFEEKIVGPYSFTYRVPVDVASFEVYAQVTDVSGIRAQSAPQTVTVLNDTDAPVVSIVIPEDNETAYADSFVVLNVEISDATDNIKFVQVLYNGVPVKFLGTEAYLNLGGAPYQTSIPIEEDALEASATIEVIAVDYAGLMTSDSVALTVVRSDYNQLLMVNNAGALFDLDTNTLIAGDLGISTGVNFVATDAKYHQQRDQLFIAMYDTQSEREQLGMVDFNAQVFSYRTGNQYFRTQTVELAEQNSQLFALLFPEYPFDYVTVMNIDSPSTSPYGYQYIRGARGTVTAPDGRIYIAEYGYEDGSHPSYWCSRITNYDLTTGNGSLTGFTSASAYRGTAINLNQAGNILYVGRFYQSANQYEIARIDTGPFTSAAGLFRTVDSEISSIESVVISGSERILAALPDNDTILVFDPTTLNEVDSWSVPSPDRLQFDTIENALFVFSKADNLIAKIDVETGTVVAQNSVAGPVAVFGRINKLLPDVAVPVVTIVSPLDNESYFEGHLLSIQISAVDENIDAIEMFYNNIKAETINANGQSSLTILKRLPIIDGASDVLTIEVRAKDMFGNIGRSDKIAITILDDTEAPAVTMTEPIAGQTVIGGSWVDVIGVSTDNSGTQSMVEIIEIYFDNDIIDVLSPEEDGTFDRPIVIPVNVYSDPMTVGVIAQDYAGNRSSKISVQVNLLFEAEPTAGYDDRDVYDTYVLDDKLYITSYQILEVYDISSLIPGGGGEGESGVGETGIGGELEFAGSELSFLGNVPRISTANRLVYTSTANPYSLYHFVVENGFIYGVGTYSGWSSTQFIVMGASFDPYDFNLKAQIQLDDETIENREGVILLNGDRAYVGHDDGVWVLNVRFPNSPVVLPGIEDNDSGTLALEATEDNLYRLTRRGQIHVYELDNLELLQTITLYTPAPEAPLPDFGDLEVKDSVLYATDEIGGLFSVGITQTPLSFGTPAFILIDDLDGEMPMGIDSIGDFTVIHGMNDVFFLDTSSLGSEIVLGSVSQFTNVPIEYQITDCYIYGNQLIVQSGEAAIVNIYHDLGGAPTVELDLPADINDRHYIGGESSVLIPFDA
ncbi:MAG: beta-propeller fold lactonase family protein [bacterium]|nr:beta-propeller fold lactonase family protein [bacterium]